MKHLALAVTALALASCQQSVDQKFKAICDNMKNDPDAPRVGEEQCNDPSDLDDTTKTLIVNMNERQRARSEAAQ